MKRAGIRKHSGELLEGEVGGNIVFPTYTVADARLLSGGFPICKCCGNRVYFADEIQETEGKEPRAFHHKPKDVDSCLVATRDELASLPPSSLTACDRLRLERVSFVIGRNELDFRCIPENLIATSAYDYERAYQDMVCQIASGEELERALERAYITQPQLLSIKGLDPESAHRVGLFLAGSYRRQGRRNARCTFIPDGDVNYIQTEAGRMLGRREKDYAAWAPAKLHVFFVNRDGLRPVYWNGDREKAKSFVFPLQRRAPVYSIDPFYRRNAPVHT